MADGEQFFVGDRPYTRSHLKSRKATRRGVEKACRVTGFSNSIRLSSLYLNTIMSEHPLTSKHIEEADLKYRMKQHKRLFWLLSTAAGLFFFSRLHDCTADPAC
ncbi:MAG: hypothetical protein HC899_09460 [Leptolyngbyaceae cyanobacterium SM1_4_3]|nr:hypothetical protein [Leptolyngbyaceae cyanobacterium SM1_4_3]